MTSELSRLTFAYSPYSADCSGPADRRRFCYFAAKRGIRFEKARYDQEYDVVVLSTLADLTFWSRYPRARTKIVFDLPDSYFSMDPWKPKALLRGVAKFVLRQHRYLELSHLRALERMCARADAVICSTPEQSDVIRRYSANVHPILDFHVADAARRKENFSTGPTVNLLWEGLGGNVFTLGRLGGVLSRVGRRHPLTLHLITDVKYKPLNGPVPRRSTQSLVERLLPDVRCAVYQWHPATFASIATACDIGLIPIAVEDPLHLAKPENKLLLLWRMAIPTITSATPAYERAMNATGHDLLCRVDGDWERSLESLINDEARRQHVAMSGLRYAEDLHGEEAILDRWDQVFESVLT